MKAVAVGEADAYVGNLTLASHLILAKGLGNLKVAAPTDLGDHVFSFGVRKDWPELSSIIDKGLDSSTPEVRASIRSRYMTVRYEHGITSADVLKWGSGIVAVAVVVLALFLGWNRLLARGVRVRTSELAESEERFRSTFEQAAVGVAHVALDGRFLRVNQQFCDFVGYTHDEMLARTFGDITCPEDLQADEANVRRLLEGEASSYSMEKRYIRKGGDTVWANLTASLVRKADGEPGWFVSVVEDISERKQAEELLQGYQERLKGLASELTLAEERERRRIAAELHDGIAQSLAFARIQLASAVKTVGEATVTGRLEETSGLLREAIEGIQGIVHDLSSPSMNEIGLAAAVSEWLEEHVEKRHGIATEFTDECEGIVLDEDVRAVLFRTVRELATNAVKYARAGRIAVRMSCSGGNLHISVEDDGVGFDPDAASDAVGRGGGFGLFSIRERMADLGGSLEIVSRPGKGCHAVVTVPHASEKREEA